MFCSYPAWQTSPGSWNFRTARRPGFVPAPDVPALVTVVPIDLTWSPGFALAQKKKNIHALHAAAAARGLSPLLEISTKADEKPGRHLSAFHLTVRSAGGAIPLECAFQGSKVFEEGGPYTDLYSADVRAAKRDPRLKTSGNTHSFPRACRGTRDRSVLCLFCGGSASASGVGVRVRT